MGSENSTRTSPVAGAYAWELGLEVGLDIRIPPSAYTEALERHLAEEWAPSRNLTFDVRCHLKSLNRGSLSLTTLGSLLAITPADSSNPWWPVFEEAVKRAGGKLGKPEIFPASTDVHYLPELGLPAFGLSPMANTTILLHGHNEFLSEDEYLRNRDIRVHHQSTGNSQR